MSTIPPDMPPRPRTPHRFSVRALLLVIAAAAIFFSLVAWQGTSFAASAGFVVVALAMIAEGAHRRHVVETVVGSVALLMGLAMLLPHLLPYLPRSM